MPEINPALVPTISPGNLFSRFTTDDTLNVRWLTATDPVLWEALNRPIADTVLRQLIMAKAIDAIELRLGHMTLFPFLITPLLDVGTTNIELPVAWIWDMHVSMPAKWEYVRLAKIKRISGTNTGGSSGDQITGVLRLIFTAQAEGSAVEVALFSVDYRIDSNLSYQILRVTIATSSEESNPIDPSEAETVDGFIIFRTLDLTDSTVQSFFQYVAPPASTTDSNSDGIFDNPAVYEIVSTAPGGTDDFLAASLNHGTGIVVASAWNSIPSLDSDFATWLRSVNYPFRIGASRLSIEGITVPQALFNEFSLVVPANDEPTGDATLAFSPVWLSAIDRLDSLASSLKFVFSTHSILDDGATPAIVEFAALTLDRSYESGRVVNIEPIDDLLKAEGTDQENYRQGFGLGHVVLGSVWGSTSDDITQFFDSFLALVTTSRATFTKEAGILSSFALDRNSRYIASKGQWEALKGTTGRATIPVGPSDSNRYITEGDQGRGDAVDFRTLSGFTENVDIEPVGYSGSLAHKAVVLIVDTSGSAHDYDTDILPRLRCLLGRDPTYFDIWWDGTIFKMFNGDSWISI